MNNINSIINALKGSSSDEAIDKVVKMVKSGEAGMTAKQAIAIANRLIPMLEGEQKEKVRKLIKKLRE